MNNSEDIFAEGKKRMQELITQLNNIEPTNILGIIDASGVSASKLAGEELWTLMFTFEGWKVKNGVLKLDKLTIRKLVTEEEDDELRELLNPYDIIEIRARMSEENIFNCPQALLLETVNNKLIDKELQSYSSKLQEPVTFQDQFFGILTLNRQMNCFEAEITWQSERINLNLSMDDCEDRDEFLKLARSIWNSQDEWSKKIEQFAVDKLLSLKKEAWLDEDEREFTPDEFIKRMTLESITLEPDGNFEFWYDDGDLFWGHSIQVIGNIKDGPIDADIPG